MVYDLADIERRLDAGEWLRSGEVAAVLGIGRTTVHRMLSNGVISHRVRPGTGGQRECNPEVVRKLLAERRRIRSGPEQSDRSGE